MYPWQGSVGVLGQQSQQRTRVGRKCSTEKKGKEGGSAAGKVWVRIRILEKRDQHKKIQVRKSWSSVSKDNNWAATKDREQQQLLDEGGLMW